MLRQISLSALVAVICTSCGSDAVAPGRGTLQPPDWRPYRAPTVRLPTGPSHPSHQYRAALEDRFSFRDLQSEGDESLARRLLGQAGRRIAYIDRHRDRWRLYQGDEDGAENIDLYTHPYTTGSQFGLCGVERYAIEFDDNGRIESVRVTQRYGVEGPVFERGDYESGAHRTICASAPAANAPSYFPAPDAILAYEAAHVMMALFDRAASPDALPFRLQCRTWDRRACSQTVRAYLGRLRLGDIDEFSRVNCPFDETPGQVCFTITTDEHRVGPYPKRITIKGSPHADSLRVISVEVVESETMT